MIEISYANVMNGFNKGINMTLVCPTMQEADRLYGKARELWFIKGFCSCKGAERTMEYGITLPQSVSLRFKSLSVIQENWRGFRGIFMIHPDIVPESLSGQEYRRIDEMNEHNTKYLEQWRA